MVNIITAISVYTVCVVECLPTRDFSKFYRIIDNNSDQSETAFVKPVIEEPMGGYSFLNQYFKINAVNKLNDLTEVNTALEETLTVPKLIEPSMKKKQQLHKNQKINHLRRRLFLRHHNRKNKE